jgi:hypothetical protein
MVLKQNTRRTNLYRHFYLLEKAPPLSLDYLDMYMVHGQLILKHCSVDRAIPSHQQIRAVLFCLSVCLSCTANFLHGFHRRQQGKVPSTGSFWNKKGQLSTVARLAQACSGKDRKRKITLARPKFHISFIHVVHSYPHFHII